MFRVYEVFLTRLYTPQGVTLCNHDSVYIYQATISDNLEAFLQNPMINHGVKAGVNSLCPYYPSGYETFMNMQHFP